MRRSRLIGKIIFNTELVQEVGFMSEKGFLANSRIIAQAQNPYSRVYHLVRKWSDLNTRLSKVVNDVQ
jgi:hypothetical protein